MTMFKNIGAVAVMMLGSATIAASQSAPDPWKKVPAAPTTYLADRDFSLKLEQVGAEVSDAHRKQTEINIDIETKFGKMDMQEKMSRMQAFMMKDPQKAMKMMQAEQAAAARITSDIMSGDEAKTERNSEFEKLSAAFKAEMEAAAKPFRAKREEIKKTGTVPVNEHGNVSWAFKTQAAETAFNEQVDKENAEISARSAAWFGPGGKFTTWLASYRATVLDPNARAEEANDELKTAQMALMETPSAAFRSTAQLKAVREYLEVMGKVYDLRIDKEPYVHKMG
jgi:hypothetical protein